MAIGARTSPQLVLTGTVLAHRSQKSKDKGEYYATDLTVETSGGNVYARIWKSSDLLPENFPVLGTIAVVVSVRETDRGAELAVERELTDNDLDKIVSASRVAEPAGK